VNGLKVEERVCITSADSDWDEVVHTVCDKCWVDCMAPGVKALCGYQYDDGGEEWNGDDDECVVCVDLERWHSCE
jgi:hypothetical protein